MTFDVTALDFARGGGLVPVIAQHALTGTVLMLGYADREALDRSIATGLLHFHSRSRNALWQKGETSGNTLTLVGLDADCDDDAVLARVLPAGPTCHTGNASCFAGRPTLAALADVLDARIAGGDSASSYTARLFADRNLRLKKLGEEAVELALACSAADGERIAEEAADLLYHMLVACRAEEVTLANVLALLEKRLT